MQNARGTTSVTSYKPSPYEKPDAGPELAEVHVGETFSGDIVGNATARVIQVTHVDGSASFCGMERVTGLAAGRRGTFLLQVEGEVADKKINAVWFVVPDSGTAELAGLRGTGGFEADLGQSGSWWLDYELP